MTPATIAERRRAHLQDLVPGLLFLAAVILYAPRLDAPPQYMFDEVYHAYTAGQYVQGNGAAYVWYTTAPRKDVAYMWNHPPAGLLIIAGGILVWGDDPFGWRFASVLFGAAGVTLAYFVALRLTRDRFAALLGAGLLLLDGLYFAQSRIGMLDIFGMVFSLAALATLHGYLTTPFERAGPRIARVGLWLGLALATKWNASYPALLVGLVIVGRTLVEGSRALCGLAGKAPRGTVGGSARADVAAAPPRSVLGAESDPGARTPVPSEAGSPPGVGGEAARDSSEGSPRRSDRDASRAGVRSHLLWGPVGLVLVPALVYMAAYIPFFAVGHSLGEFVELQKQIFYYHTRLEATHPYQSAWWQWPLALRPVWYATWRQGSRVANIYANGNPVLCWLFLPAVLWFAVRLWRGRKAGLAVLLIGFFGQWLPWALVPRIAFAYHFLPAVPWGTIALGAALSHLSSEGRAGRALVAVYLVLAIAAFVFFYPVWSGIPIEPASFERRIWFESWR